MPLYKKNRLINKIINIDMTNNNGWLSAENKHKATWFQEIKQQV